MTFHIITGNCLEVLRELDAESVHCVVSSPPYWGLRDYGIPPTIWGGAPDCDHDWGGDVVVQSSDRAPSGSSTLKGNGHSGGGPKLHRDRESSVQNFCAHCGAWRGNFGLEPTPDLFIDHLVLIFEEVRRVLRKDGTLWLNLGDSYYSPRYNGGVGENSTINGQDAQEEYRKARKRRVTNSKTIEAADFVSPHRAIAIPGLKAKDLVGIPWMAAFALRRAGWYLRRDCIWFKLNPMPESTPDRCTTAHEYLFHLSKSEHYYFDQEAIKEDVSDNTHARKDKGAAIPKEGPKAVEHGTGIKTNHDFHAATSDLVSKRNKRSVWTVATQPFAEAHFATFPPALIEPCILAGTSERGCCPTCLTGWERVTVDMDTGKTQKMPDGMATYEGGHTSIHKDGREKGVSGNPVMAAVTIGWYPACKCAGLPKLPKCPRAPSTKGLDEATKETRLAPWRAECLRITAERRLLCEPAAKLKTKRAVVLDPFGGAGTTALVADRLQRDSLIIELNADYAEMARRRITGDSPLFATAAE